MFQDQFSEDIPTPPTVSSPLKKLQRQIPDISPSSSALPFVYSYRSFDVMMNLTPSQILSIQEDQTDYICGVKDTAHVCRKTFYCHLHSLEERLGVKRSLPLKCLMVEESKNIAWFRKRRMLTKFYQDCKSYWKKHPSASATPVTCSRSSCVPAASSKNSSPNCVSLCSQISSDSNTMIEKGAFSSLKKAFLKNISRSAGTRKEDVMSYLFYKLTGYEDVSIDLRAREMEVRYSRSESDFEKSYV